MPKQKQTGPGRPKSGRSRMITPVISVATYNRLRAHGIATKASYGVIVEAALAAYLASAAK